MNCPRCGKKQYPVCSNPDCVCYKSIPEGERPQINHDEVDTSSCPYCGFTAHIDFWETRALEAFMLEMDADSMSEAILKYAERNKE